MTEFEPVLDWPGRPTLMTEAGGEDPLGEEDKEEDDDEAVLPFALAALRQGREENISSEDGLFRKLNVLKNPPVVAPVVVDTAAAAPVGLDNKCCCWLIRLLGLMMLPFR